MAKKKEARERKKIPEKNKKNKQSLNFFQKFKKTKKRSSLTSRKKASPARKNKSKVEAVPSAEKKEILKKNLILAGIVILLVIFNVWFYLAKKGSREGAPSKNLNSNISRSVSDEARKAIDDNKANPPETEEETANDKVIQELLKEKEVESWRTYQNKAYGFEIKYPQEWPAPAVSGQQTGYKFRYKVTLREKSDSGEPSNGLDIYIYRNAQPNNKTLKADYTDNLVVKDMAAVDYSNCNVMEVFSIGTEEYPAAQVYALNNDPCFHEAYFFSLKKGFYIYDIVPFLKSGINYDGYDGEKKVNAEFPDFYKVMATLNFPVVKQTVTNPVTNTATQKSTKPKVEAPKVSGGIRCPEKIQHPHKSATKGKHMDEDCCPDPDEWPKPGCAYSAHDYSIMISKPKK